MSQGHKQPPEPTLFIEATDLYRHIPKGHFYERLAQILDLSFVYELTRPLYAPKLGRPSLDPVVFFKCMLAGFFENVVYDTELEYRIADSLTLRKFLGYSLEERTPDESTLRKTRRSMPEEVFHAVFARVLDQCQAAGLLKGRVVGTDSTQVDANASMESLRHKTLGCTYEEYILALRRQDQPEATPAAAKAGDRNRTGKASNQEWESTTDPQARVMQHADGHTHLSFRVDTTVDLETGVLVVAGAEYANVSDQADFLGRVDEAEATLAERGLGLLAVVADKGHHSGENLAGLAERELVGLISSPNSTRGQPGFRREDFTYDAERDQFVCPAGGGAAPAAVAGRASATVSSAGERLPRLPALRSVYAEQDGTESLGAGARGTDPGEPRAGPGPGVPAPLPDPAAAGGGTVRLLQAVRRTAAVRGAGAGVRPEEDADRGGRVESAPAAGPRGVSRG